MAYGTVKVDNITFTNGGIDQTVTVSGIVQSISGNITATGTIQAATIIGTSTVSGATVTGNAGVFTTVTGGSAGFTTVTGTTVTGTTANFATISGTTITGGAVTVASGTFSGNSTAAAFIPTGSTVPTNGLYLPAANSVALSTSGTGRLFVDASGNVLINDSASVTSNVSGYLRIRQVNAAADTSIGIINAQNSDASATVKIKAGQATRNGGEIVFGRENGGDWTTTTAADGYIAFSPVLNNTNTERLRITSAGLVGVGTSLPGDVLHIKGGSTYAGVIADNSAATGGGAFRAYRNGVQKAIFCADSWITGTSSDDAAIYADAGGGIKFYTNNSSTAKAVLTSGGSLGIGTTNVNSLLHLGFSISHLHFEQESISEKPLIRATRTTDKANRLLNIGGSEVAFLIGSTATTALSSADEKARIDSSGRLLVGTSSSTTDRFLQVEGTDVNSSSLSIRRNANSHSSSILQLSKSRGTTGGSYTTVAQDDSLGQINFYGANGTSDLNAARIEALVDGEPNTGGDTTDMPGRLVFSVTADGSASPSEAMRINNAGELLVGYTSDNGAYKLQVNSQIFATSAIIATSDGRYKENVAALDGCVDLVKALRPVSFDWKAQEPVTRVDEDGETVVVREAHNFPDGKQVGFIAQEVEEVLADKPWLGSVIKQNVRPAVTDADGNELAPEEEFLGIAEGNLVAVLTSALKDAIGRIESLEAKVAALESA